jgi:hypothetical protein
MIEFFLGIKLFVLIYAILTLVKTAFSFLVVLYRQEGKFEMKKFDKLLCELSIVFILTIIFTSI